jgi:hypothetical protein
VLLGHPLSTHLVLGLQELNLLLEVIRSGSGQQKQQGVEDAYHPKKMLLNLGKNGDVAIVLYPDISRCSAASA